MSLGVFVGVLPCILISALFWARRQEASQRSRYLIALLLGGGVGIMLVTLYLLPTASFSTFAFVARCLIAAPLGALIALATILVTEGGDDAIS